jgi:hypothetical protein
MAVADTSFVPITFTDAERALIRERMQRLGLYAPGCIGAVELGRVILCGGDDVTPESVAAFKRRLLGQERSNDTEA